MKNDNARLLNYALFAVGLLPFYLLPIWAGMFDEVFGFSGSQIGVLLTADLAAGTVASLVARFWIHQAKWPPVMLWSVLATVALNAASAAAADYYLLVLLRCAAGFTAGTMMAFAYAYFANAEDPDREFSLALGLQVALGAAGIAATSFLLRTQGTTAVFLFTAGVSLLPLVFYRDCPDSIHPDASPEPAMQIPSVPVSLALLAVTLFMLALTAVWVFVERIAYSQGYDSTAIGFVLSAALLFSFLGAVSPALVSRLAKRRTLVTIGYATLAIAVAAFGAPTSVWLFAIALVAYNFFYSFVMPLQTAWIASSDTSGRNAVLVPVAQGVGATLGPLVAGMVVGGIGYDAVIWLCLGTLLLSFVAVRFAGEKLSD